MDGLWTLPVSLGQDSLNLKGSTSTGEITKQDPINVDGNALQQSLNSIMAKLDVLLSESSKHVKNFSVSEVKVSLAVDASGEVSLLGIFKAGATSKSAIEVKFSPRNQT